MASLKRKRLNSSSSERAANTVESLRADGSSRVQVGNSYTEVHNYEGRRADDECLRDLRTTDPRDDKTRITKEKGGLLSGSYDWVLESSEFQQWFQGTQNRLLWIKGDPGKGKTMLLCGLIDELTKSQHALSYFFCQATDSRINNATSVLRGLIYLLVVQDTSLTRHVRTKWDHGGKSTFDPPNGLHVLCSMFQNILSDHSNPTYLVIDALDECEESSLPSLLGLIVDTTSKFHHVKWLVSSRNFPVIERELGGANPSGRLDLSLEANACNVSRAVADYIDHKVRNLPKVCSDTELHKEFKETMQDKANGTFLWAALVLGQLKKEEDDELENNWDILKTLNEIPEGMANLYDRMWRQISTQGHRNSSSCKVILGTMFLAYRPLQLQELSLLAGFKGNLANTGTLMKLVRLCGSFLSIQQETKIVHFVHQSAKDFLTDNKHAFDGMFSSGTGEGHHRLFSRSLTAMAAPITGLRQNIYGLCNPGVLTSEIEMPVPDSLAVMRYSCVHWLDHFYEWVSSKQDRDQNDANDVTTFLQDKYLYWLEALGLCGSITQGIVSIRKLEALAVHNQWDYLATLVRDARRFVLANRQGIETAPLQVYVSALIFCPTSSWVRKRFETMIPEWIKKKPKVQPEWDACLLTLEGHNSQVHHLAFSPDSRIIASTDQKGTIKIWDLDTGACLNTISGHDSMVYGLAFLSQEPSTILVSAGKGSNGYSIKIWDPFNRGPPRRTFAMPNKMSDAITFLAGSKSAVWADEKGTLIKLDLDTGTLLDTIKLPTKPIAVSPDGQTIITSESERLQVFDWGHPGTDLITIDFFPENGSVAISPDNTRVVVERVGPSPSLGVGIDVWDFTTDTCAASLSDVSGIGSFSFSSDGTVIAFGDLDGKVGLWDTTTDTTQVLSGHSNSIWAVAISPDGRLLASGCKDETIKIWDLTIKTSLEFDPDTTRGPQDWLLSPNGLWVALTVFGHYIHIWRPATDEFAHELYESTLGPLYSEIVLKDILEFSPCERWLACWVPDGIKIWDTTTWKIQLELKPQLLSEWKFCLSMLSNILGQVSRENETVEIWDLHTRRPRSTFSSSLCKDFTDMSFSPNGLWLVLASRERFEIWDWAAKGCIQVVNECLSEISWHPTHDALLHTSHGSYCVQGSTGHYWIDKVQMQEEEDEKDEYPVQMTEDSKWVTVQGQRVLWIPSQYQPCFKFDDALYDTIDERAVDCNKSAVAILDSCYRSIYIEFDVPEIVLKF